MPLIRLSAIQIHYNNNEERQFIMKLKWQIFYKSKWFFPVCTLLFLSMATFVIYEVMNVFHLWVAILVVVLFAFVIKSLAIILGAVLSIFKWILLNGYCLSRSVIPAFCICRMSYDHLYLSVAKIIASCVSGLLPSTLVILNL